MAVEMSTTLNCSSVVTNTKDIEFFNNLSSEWWDETSGPVVLLHRLNKLMVPFIEENAINNDVLKITLKDLNILDVGCAGGSLTEQLSKTGATVVGVDVSPDLIKVAREHASLNSRLTNLTYKIESVEEHCLSNFEKYDIVVACGVIEHVENPELFLESCIKCLKPGGSIYITTFNKTIIAYLVGIIIAEYIFGLIPVGSHDWNKFISPEEVQKICRKYKCEMKEVRGVFYNILTRKFFWLQNNSVGYVLRAVKDLSI